LLDGIDDFYKGLDRVKNGKKFVSQSVQERIDMREEKPVPAKKISEREIEVIRLTRNGLSSSEVGNVLHISEPTVNRHKANIYLNLNVRNENELYRTAEYLGLINKDEQIFSAPDLVLKPLPGKQEKPMIRRVK
jgi:DNA-binding NarL/FixJ family response regulator